jgi:type II secretory ATPase GspE/PulE/Tfp pilus assembly ATPase PilB-like protein
VQPYQPEPSSLAALPPEVIEAAQFSRGAGCNECLQTGYAGRIAVTELMVVNEVVRDAILKKMPTRTLQEVVIAQGMQTLWQNGLRRVVNGQTTLEEMLRVLAIDQL